MKKVLAILLCIVIVFGWFVTLKGLGPLKPLKDEMKLGLDLKGGVYVVMEAKTKAKGEDLKKLMDQTQAVIEKRVNEMGLSEPVVTIEGENRIRVELPGAKDSDEAIKQIGKTAQLQFMTADQKLVLDGSNVKNAGVGRDEKKGGYAVTLEFDTKGSAAFEEATRKIVNKSIVSKDPQKIPADAIYIILDNKVISNPRVDSVISGGKCEITGHFTSEQATSLSALIRGGALPVELKEIETNMVGPHVGIDALANSIKGGVIGFVLLIILMLAVYRLMGLCANLALLIYVLIEFWAIVALGGVMTLPGIAGLIVSIGMAVDANVIIFSRIKEELLKGRTVRVASQMGFKRAMSTIIDSQVTTMIASIILYQLGTGPVKGFALTLMIGIVASVFTAVVVTNVFLRVLSNSKLGTPGMFGVKEADIIEN